MTAHTRYLNPTSFDDPSVTLRSEPFPFIVAKDILQESQRSALGKDFPRFKEAGFFPYEESECGPAIQSLVAEATSPAVADNLGRKLGIENLSQFPTLVTICGSMNHRHGNIHTDGKSKVATALIYLNETWGDTSEGCLRFLKGPTDIDDVVAPEIKPLYGNFAMFKRTDNSYHGHLPYESERRVIQIAWLTSEKEKLRKTKRGKLSHFLKRLFGRLDKGVGAERSREAVRMD